MDLIKDILAVIGALSVVMTLAFLAWFWLDGYQSEMQDRRDAAQIDAMSAQINGENGKPDYAMTFSSQPNPPEPECRSAAPEATTPRVTAPVSPFIAGND